MNVISKQPRTTPPPARPNVPGGPRPLDLAGPAPTGPIRINPQPVRNGARVPAPAAAAPAPVERAQVREEETPRGIDGEVLGSEWERVNLPSGFAFYDWNELSVRCFSPMDHAKVARACRYKNMSLLLDVLASTSNRDVRDLTFNDFQALMIWHKFNSYTTTTFTVSWNSRYGVEGSAGTTGSSFRESPLAATRPDYLAARELGFCVPTCRDMELFSEAEDADEDTIYLFERAQWLDPAPLAARIEELRLAGDTMPRVRARIEELDRRGLKFFTEIEDFSVRFSDYAVREYTHVTLPAKQFVAETAIGVLEANGSAEALAEVAEIRAAVEAKTPYAPRKEEVPVVFNPWTMFPFI